MTLKLLLAGAKTADFRLIKLAFENADATVVVASSMALALFLARKSSPDIVIVQKQLTDSDGRSLFYEFKNEQELASIPFIFLKNDNGTEANRENDDVTPIESLPVGTHSLCLTEHIDSANGLLRLKAEIMSLIKDSLRK